MYSRTKTEPGAQNASNALTSNIDIQPVVTSQPRYLKRGLRPFTVTLL
jgi:hypothetical protein